MENNADSKTPKTEVARGKVESAIGELHGEFAILPRNTIDSGSRIDRYKAVLLIPCKKGRNSPTNE